MLVYIHSLPRKSETAISEWTNPTSGRKMSKTKNGRCTTAIAASYSPRIGGLANYISYTPWLDEKTGSPVLDENQKPLTLQDKYEQKFNKPKGYFGNSAWEKTNKQDQELTYYQRRVWRLNDGTTVLDLTKMDDLLGYYVALASQHVANSEQEYRSHKWPKATHYIALENESEQIKYRRTQLKSKAFADIHSPLLNPITKKRMLVILDLISAKANPTEEQIHNLLYSFIDNSDYTPGSNIFKFNGLMTILSTPKGRETFEARYYLKAAIDTRIVSEKHDIYTWIRPKGNLELGNRYDDAIEFFLNPKKDKEVQELRELVDQTLTQ